MCILWILICIAMKYMTARVIWNVLVGPTRDIVVTRYKWYCSRDVNALPPNWVIMFPHVMFQEMLADCKIVSSLLFETFFGQVTTAHCATLDLLQSELIPISTWPTWPFLIYVKRVPMTTICIKASLLLWKLEQITSIKNNSFKKTATQLSSSHLG